MNPQVSHKEHVSSKDHYEADLYEANNLKDYEKKWSDSEKINLYIITKINDINLNQIIRFLIIISLSQVWWRIPLILRRCVSSFKRQGCTHRPHMKPRLQKRLSLNHPEHLLKWKTWKLHSKRSTSPRLRPAFRQSQPRKSKGISSLKKEASSQSPTFN